MIDALALRRHLDDYAETFGRKTDRFVCPITLRECDDAELIDGHILNRALSVASRRRVIQYGRVDHFYGTRVERGLIAHLNPATPVDLLLGADELLVEFSDGTSAEAFVATGRAAQAAGQKFPALNAQAGSVLVPVYIRVGLDDPRLQGPLGLVGSQGFVPAHWVAALLKATHLAMFELLGYRAIRSPLGGTLRATLASYFDDNASRAHAVRYFKDFRNSVKILARGSSLRRVAADYQPFEHDTLDDRVVFFHFIGPDMFAVTCVFKINRATIAATIPQSFADADVAVAWRRYQSLMEDDRTVDQRVHPARYRNGRWEVQPTALNARYGGERELTSEWRE